MLVRKLAQLAGWKERWIRCLTETCREVAMWSELSSVLPRGNRSGYSCLVLCQSEPPVTRGFLSRIKFHNIISTTLEQLILTLVIHTTVPCSMLCTCGVIASVSLNRSVNSILRSNR
jgi:hypothetical protein